MLGRFLPQRIDSSFGGHKLSLWLLELVAVMILGLVLSLRNQDGSRAPIK